MSNAPREVFITYRLVVEMPEDAAPSDILDHPDVTAPTRAEIIDWGFDCAIPQR